MAEAVVALNAGSSNLKFSVYPGGQSSDRASEAAFMSGAVEVDGKRVRLRATGSRGETLADEALGGELDGDPSPSGCFSAQTLTSLIHWIEARLDDVRLVAAGHRIVHGGSRYVEPVRITPQILKDLEALTPFDPLHQPASLAPVRVLAHERPRIPQIACFDTSFHSGMPDVATRFALPRRYRDAGVRRYGFHGLSYAYIAQRLPQIAPDVAEGRVIVAHLGSGASLCAMRERRSVETTMGFSSLDGLMMGTRTGLIDPGALLYMLGTEQRSYEDLVDILYHQSGLLGVSGLSADMRALRAAQDCEPARQALDLFAYRIVQEIGALTATLGGLDALVFTAGVGEHDVELRQDVCQALNWLGVKLDDAANRAGRGVITTSDSRVRVLVEPTDEDVMILRAVRDRLRDGDPVGADH
ncbi:acetate kinase [Acetobacter nitrogenifigens DSM 23921 = NBRC 105050]|uniref:Acetate kinase n=1 Tax=Acetobacter nitrogenifigens DSM 23921 = NBRC 105050 TaxID=1120919 RepID=A0A511XA15_9PROT|nr:acetate/propionate family kinase [Acetobacter nitrogenifigens]GBQ97900.1 acetate kinase [Acetobacter nitrogenifigens DSM 23921 = NBRC 105050]GEN59765.1 acetate kinase [Acetobacter nitrogenifigens DSM 23921 = NBRC 105050]